MPALQSAVVGQVRTSGHLEWATGSPARGHWGSVLCLRNLGESTNSAGARHFHPWTYALTTQTCTLRAADGAHKCCEQPPPSGRSS